MQIKSRNACEVAFQGLIVIIFMFWCNAAFFDYFLEVFGPIPNIYSIMLILRHESFSHLCIDIEASHSRDWLEVAVTLYCLTRTDMYKYSCINTLERSLPVWLIDYLSMHYFTICPGSQNTLLLNTLKYRRFNQCIFVKIISILQHPYTSTEFGVITSYLRSVKSKLTLANKSAIVNMAYRENNEYIKRQLLMSIE